MSDHIQTEATVKEEEVTHFSKHLKATRETSGLSIQDAAARLNLSPRFIHLLEEENLLHVNLPPIYLRGYLRSYARLLNIAEKEINTILEKLTPTPVILTTPSVSADSLSLTFPLEDKLYFPRLATFSVFFILLSSITTWWYFHNNAATAPTTMAINLPASSTVISVENKPGLADGQETASPSSPNLPAKPQLAPSPATPATPLPKVVAGENTQAEADEGTDEQD